MIDHYPEEDELEKIRTWDYGDCKGLFEYMQGIFPFYGKIRIRGRVVRIVTGGWSGCEDMVGALRNNQMVNAMCWVMSRRGGLFIYHIPESEIKNGQSNT